MRSRTFALVCLAIIASAAPIAFNAHPPTHANQLAVPSLADVLGFTPGDDRKLASWDQVIDYFKRLDQASDRVVFEELGKSTMGKPFVMATISSPDNLSKLDEYKKIQEQLADPRKLGPPGLRDKKAAELIARGKTIVLITCGIHSTEVGSYLSSMLIAHRLASSNDPEIQNILDNTIILLVPSLNPDGVDIVKNWYDKTLGTPYEGTDPPELYHKYTGHDDNRDWYAFTQVETQITVDKIHNVWHPQIVHDIHQQGSFGSRLFLPPYMQPVEPNVPKQIVEGYTELGNYLAREMRAKGFQGITTNSTYDAWSPSRAYSHYHGGVRILSETASARLASPINVKFDDLTSREGYDPKKESANFGPLWKGGEWKLRNITNTMTTCAFLLLKNAAENRQHWLKQFYAISKQAVRTRKNGELRGFIVPIPSSNGIMPAHTDESRFLAILQTAGVEVDRLATSLNYRGQKLDALSAVINLNQPYGAFAKALLEPQHYPDLRDSSGHPIAPYDVTAHNLSMLMGVKPIPFYEPIRYQRMKIGGPSSSQRDNTEIHLILFRSSVPTNDEGWTRWVLRNQQYNYSAVGDVEVREGKFPANAKAILIPDQPPGMILNGYRAGTMPPELTGGLGEEGVKAIRQFIEEGGTLVCLNRASEFAIDQLKLPLRNVVAGLPRTQFYVPGSILRLELDTTNPIAKGMSKESIAWAEESPVFEIINNSNSAVPAANVKVIGWYPRDKDPLLSGWLLGGERIKGKAALVEVTMGKGRIILFGFRPQYRGQSLATYPLFLNSLTPK
ncbi:MAG TPA: M14 metallopeptidase family protein [Pyrinomonadaceae bacterium]